MLASRLRGFDVQPGALVAVFAYFVTQACLGSVLQVTVTTTDGKPVSDMVLTVKPVDAPAPKPLTSGKAIMDQINKEFVPEVLAIYPGTAVSFPNSDSIAHQVYSFSATKRFSLPLYRGKPYPPVIFEQPGIVALGCNIHDQMVGYIVVVDTPYFGQSNSTGQWQRELPAGTYRLHAWHPRLIDAVPDQSITIADAQNSRVTVTIDKALRPLRSVDRRIRDY